MVKKIYNYKIGDSIKEWSIISDVISEKGKQFYNVKCSCGRIVKMLAFKLGLPNQNVRCNRCSNIKNNKEKKGNGCKTIGDITGTYLNRIKGSATKRGIEFNLNEDQLWKLFLAQNGKCALSGLEITLSKERKGNHPDYSKFTASLDRIDSMKGYETGNIQWVHRKINLMKNILSVEEFIFFCSVVAKNQNN